MDPTICLSQDLLCNIAFHVYARTQLYMATLRNRQLLFTQQWRLRLSSGTTWAWLDTQWVCSHDAVQYYAEMPEKYFYYRLTQVFEFYSCEAVENTAWESFALPQLHAFWYQINLGFSTPNWPARVNRSNRESRGFNSSTWNIIPKQMNSEAALSNPIPMFSLLVYTAAIYLW